MTLLERYREEHEKGREEGRTEVRAEWGQERRKLLAAIEKLQKRVEHLKAMVVD